MNIYISQTVMMEAEDGQLSFSDVHPVAFLNSKMPLYIGARTGQVNRMKKNIEQNKLGGSSVGWWELAGKNAFVHRSGKINLDKFKEYDVIFFADPERIHDSLKKSYENFITAVKRGLNKE